MDPVSHALVGAAIGSLSRSADPALANAAYWSSMAGAVVPDVDIVVRYFGGEMAYLAHHRTWTHSLPGLIGLPVLVGLALHPFFPTAPLWFLFLWAVAGGLSHVFLDVTNSYGTMCLLPWSRRRLALDITMIVDLPIVVLMVAAMLWSRFHPATRMAAFALVLLIALVYLAARYALHRYLLRQAWRHFATERPTAISILPGLVGLRLWYVLVSTPERYITGEVRVSGPVWTNGRRFERREDDPVVAAAARHPAARIFLDFARYPYVETRRAGGRTYVTWGDLRFLFRDRPVFTLTVVLGETGEPLKAKLGRGFRRPEQLGGASV